MLALKRIDMTDLPQTPTSLLFNYNVSGSMLRRMIGVAKAEFPMLSTSVNTSNLHEACLMSHASYSQLRPKHENCVIVLELLSYVALSNVGRHGVPLCNG